MDKMQFAPRLIDPPASLTANAMSIDVEEHFQVQALSDQYAREIWPQLESRVARNTERALQCFSDSGARATFFVLSWVAERHKDLMRRIVAEGHEIASHGVSHIRADSQSRDQFREDVRTSKKIIEDASGAAVIGFRAATFSIGAGNLWAFEILADEGYAYSSSVNPVQTDNYGMKEAPRFAFHPIDGHPFTEIPLSSLAIGGRNLPCAGGGYFRLWPYELTRFAVRRVNHRDGWPFIFYFHPWELDPDQPRPDTLTVKSRVRHYLNLERMEQRLRRLLDDFAWDRIDRVFGIDEAQSSGSRT